MEKPSRGGEKRIAVWASYPEEQGSDDVVAPPVCDHRVIPHRWVGFERWGVLQICTFAALYAILVPSSEGGGYGPPSRALSPLSRRSGHQGWQDHSWSTTLEVTEPALLRCHGLGFYIPEQFGGRDM